MLLTKKYMKTSFFLLLCFSSVFCLRYFCYLYFYKNFIVVSNIHELLLLFRISYDFENFLMCQITNAWLGEHFELSCRMLFIMMVSLKNRIRSLLSWYFPVLKNRLGKLKCLSIKLKPPNYIKCQFLHCNKSSIKIKWIH